MTQKQPHHQHGAQLLHLPSQGPCATELSARKSTELIFPMPSNRCFSR